MATNTTYLGLSKPDINDNVEDTIPSLASNFQKIDDKIGEVTSSLADNAKLIKNNVIDVTDKEFGAKGDGITDDTIAIQSVINYIEANFGDKGGIIQFPQGRKFVFTSVRIKSPHIRLTGGGVLQGKIVIKAVENLVTGSNAIPSLYTVIDNLKFIAFDGHNDDAILIQNTKDVTIKGCHFEFFRYGVYGEPTKDDCSNQQTARVRIIDCVFRSCVNSIKTHWIPWRAEINGLWTPHQNGDWLIKGCYFYATSAKDVDQVRLEGQDGAIIKGNFFFHGSSNQQSAIKATNIFIKQSNWIIISDNNLFEAGTESIRCEDVRTLNIHGNNIAWAGQRIPSDGITILTNDTSISSTLVSIKDNVINGTTRHGIFINGYVRNCSIDGNVMQNEGSSTAYYGTTPLNSISHFSIVVEDLNTGQTDEDNVMIANNFYSKSISRGRGVALNNGLKGYVTANRKFGNVSTSPISSSGSFNISAHVDDNSNPFGRYPFMFKNWTGTLSALTGADIGQIVTISPFGAASTLNVTHSTTGATDELVLKNGANLTLTGRQAITLQKTDTCWFQI